jgi:transcription antitermination factor NusG
MGEACLNLSREFSNPPLSADPFGPAWYSVQTGYRSELRVARDLTMKGLETYLPLLHEIHQWKDRRKAVDVPAFSGYLFVRYEPSLRNRIKVLETSGVVRLLGGNHSPSPIPEFEIEAVRRTLSSGVECTRCDNLTPGSAVRVMRGPLSGVQGTLVRIKNCFRIVVAISVFSQAISAELGLNDVEALHEVHNRALLMKEAPANQILY